MVNFAGHFTIRVRPVILALVYGSAMEIDTARGSPKEAEVAAASRTYAA